MIENDRFVWIGHWKYSKKLFEEIIKARSFYRSYKEKVENEKGCKKSDQSMKRTERKTDSLELRMIR